MLSILLPKTPSMEDHAQLAEAQIREAQSTLHSPTGIAVVNKHQFEQFLQKLTAHLDVDITFSGRLDRRLDFHRYPERVRNINSHLPMADLEQVNRIVQNKFNPWDISRIRKDDYFDTSKRNGDHTDYPDFMTWLQYWMYYQSALLLLFPESNLLSCGMALHLHRIIKWERIYTWSSVLAYCMAYHHKAIQRGVENPDSWMHEIPELRNAYFHETLSNHRAPPNISAFPQADQPPATRYATSEIHGRYNYRRKSYPGTGCYRRHFCFGCSSSMHLHPECLLAPALFVQDFENDRKRERK